MIDIPANTNTVLTEELKEQFVAEGCYPNCHGCHKTISIGDIFKLATIATRKGVTNPAVVSMDVMLCDKCNSLKVAKQEMEKALSRASSEAYLRGKRRGRAECEPKSVGKGYIRVNRRLDDV